ncbi:DUF6193 family natural product biosynthesis protein [Streptomyces sp. NPDC056773]|uniref:DUF6193 family natural product biosynthesis protein n=1 Tax=unclassified Streptomyces TaxID=2593676 RepID=UPI0036C66092
MPSDFAPLLDATVASALPHRKPLEIRARAHQRWWSLCGAEAFQGLPLLGGGTDDLAQVARAARAWHDGEALDDVQQAAPFVHLTGRFEVPDNDPTRLTESEWQSMRQKAEQLESASWRRAFQALIEAARAEPALRALYPFTSHWVLRFSTTTRPSLTLAGPCLFANSDGTFGVGAGFLTPDLGLFTTAHEAVALAVRHLPPALGPITLGRPL